MAKLTFILQDGQEVEVQLREDITIGRSEDNEIVVDAPLISARHARVKRAARGEFEVFDLQSEGGTFVNDERVEQHLLTHGDRLKFGLLHAVFAQDIEENERQSANGDDRFDWLGGDRDLLEQNSSQELNQRRSRSRFEPDEEGVLEKQLESLEQKRVWIEGEINARQQILADLHSKLEAQGMPQGIAEEVQVLEMRRDAILGNLRDAHARLESLQITARRVEESRLQDEERLRSLQVEIAQAKSACADAVELRHQAEGQFAAEQSRLDVLRAETALVEEQLARLNEDSRIKSEELQDRQAKVEVLLGEEQRLLALTAQTEQIEEKHATRQREMTELQAVYDARQFESQQILQTTQKTLQECEAMDARRKETELCLQAILDEYAIAVSNLEAFQAETESCSQQLQETQALMNGKNQEFAALQAHLIQLQNSRDELQKRVDDLAGSAERLTEAKEQLQQTKNQQSDLDSALAELVRRRDDEEKSLAQLTLALEQLEYNSQAQDLTLQNLKEESERQQTALEQTKATLQTETKALAKLRGKAETAQAEFVRLTSEIETAAARLEATQKERADIARQCEELADTEAKLEKALAELDRLNTVCHDRQTKIEGLTAQRDSLQEAVKSLGQQEKELTQTVAALKKRRTDLNDALASLDERERIDRERFKEIQKLVADAEQERNVQIDHLDRQILFKQRELLEVEERLEPLRQWKEEMEWRHEQMGAVGEDSEEARARWRAMNAEKGHLGQILVEKETARSATYSSGPVLRGHARQLEAKIRRDQERHATLCRKIEQLVTEEMDRSERVASLERRLAQLRVDIARAERDNPGLGLEFGEEQPQAETPPPGGSKSILSSIIDGARSKLKPMVPHRED